jgi:hypothetical protein
MPSAAPAKTATAVSAPRRLKVTGGTVLYDDVAAARHEELTELDLDAQWPNAAVPLTGGGTMRWRGEPSTSTARWATPRRTAAVHLLAAPREPVRLFFNGTIGPAITARRRSRPSPSAGRRVDGQANGQRSTSARLRFRRRSMDGHRRLPRRRPDRADGNSAVGALVVDYGGGRPRIEGTPAATRLDLSPYIEAPGSAASPIPPRSTAPAALPASPLDADLRISADQVLAGPHRQGRGRPVDQEQPSLSVGEAQLYGGTLTPTRTSAASATSSWPRRAPLAGVALRPALADLAGVQAFDGAASGQINPQRAGRELAELIRAWSRSTFSVSDGAIGRVSIRQLASPPTLARARAPVGTPGFAQPAARRRSTPALSRRPMPPSGPATTGSTSSGLGFARQWPDRCAGDAVAAGRRQGPASADRHRRYLAPPPADSTRERSAAPARRLLSPRVGIPEVAAGSVGATPAAA